MNRHITAALAVSGATAALWLLGRVCDIGEALTRDLIHQLFSLYQQKDRDE